MPGTETSHLDVNGQAVEAHIDPATSLLTFLREDLGLTGTKNGCNEGTCACTVIVDGEAKRACRLKLGRVAGCHVRTIEGLAKEERLHPLQYTMIREGAIQCGFCTPGMIAVYDAIGARVYSLPITPDKTAAARNAAQSAADK